MKWRESRRYAGVKRGLSPVAGNPLLAAVGTGNVMPRNPIGAWGRRRAGVIRPSATGS